MERPFDILSIVLASIALALVIWTVGTRIWCGELLVTLEKTTAKGRKLERIVRFILMPIAIGIMIFSLVAFKGDSLSLTGDILYGISLILMYLFNIIRKDGTSEIREKGLYIYNGFYRYRKLVSYTWIEDDVLRVNYINIFRQDDYVEIEIKDKDTVLKADEVLGKYIIKKV